MKATTTLSFLVSILILGCGNPADHVPKATVSAPPTNGPSAHEPSLAARKYLITPDNSKIEFVGSKVTGKHDGGFHQFGGAIEVANEKIVESGTKVTIDTTSIWSDNNRLTAHLKSPDFFDVEKYPTATFEPTSISGEGSDFRVTGNLTLHGITKQITFPARIEITDDFVYVAAEFAIDRFDFEMKYPGKADDLIRKDVVLKLDVKATPQPAAPSA